MAELVVDLANKVSGVGVKTSYGDRVDIDGTTVLPVALGWYGFGGGSGEGSASPAAKNEGIDGSGSGSGGGGGGVSIPVGAYIGRDGEVRFEPNLIALVAVATPVVWIVTRGLARLIRALKH